jgi:hypothetical protein
MIASYLMLSIAPTKAQSSKPEDKEVCKFRARFTELVRIFSCTVPLACANCRASTGRGGEEENGGNPCTRGEGRRLCIEGRKSYI